jgi:hypothetical protein
MHVLLNIGLTSGARRLGTGTVMREVIGAFGAASFTFHQSDTEPTCVAAVGAKSDSELQGRVSRLAQLLDQDCIAVYLPEREHGVLVGPRAAAWGPFDPAFFLMPDGSRLADRLMPAAA